MAPEAVVKIQPGRERRLRFRRAHAALAVSALAGLAACTTSTSAVPAAAGDPVPSVSEAIVQLSAPEFRGDYAPLIAQSGFVSAYRRLTESQYRHAIADTFDPDIVINARFEPERREDGLQAVGSAQLSVTTTG